MEVALGLSRLRWSRLERHAADLSKLSRSCCQVAHEKTCGVTCDSGWAFWYKSSLSRFTTFAKQSAGFESLSVMALEMVCQKNNPLSCAISEIEPINFVLLPSSIQSL